MGRVGPVLQRGGEVLRGLSLSCIYEPEFACCFLIPFTCRRAPTPCVGACAFARVRAFARAFACVRFLFSACARGEMWNRGSRTRVGRGIPPFIKEISSFIKEIAFYAYVSREESSKKFLPCECKIYLSKGGWSFHPPRGLVLIVLALPRLTPPALPARARSVRGHTHGAAVDGDTLQNVSEKFHACMVSRGVASRARYAPVMLGCRCCLLEEIPS